jgi:hypothetical protein
MDRNEISKLLMEKANLESVNLMQEMQIRNMQQRLADMERERQMMGSRQEELQRMLVEEMMLRQQEEQRRKDLEKELEELRFEAKMEVPPKK